MYNFFFSDIYIYKLLRFWAVVRGAVMGRLQECLCRYLLKTAEAAGVYIYNVSGGLVEVHAR